MGCARRSCRQRRRSGRRRGGRPVFVDATGRRRKVVTGLGWLVALACVAYLGVIGVSMTGTSVGPLPDLPSVASRVVVFGSETDGLPQGALEAPLPAPALAPPAPAAPQAAAAPNFGDAAKVAARGGAAPTARRNWRRNRQVAAEDRVEEGAHRPPGLVVRPGRGRIAMTLRLVWPPRHRRCSSPPPPCAPKVAVDRTGRRDVLQRAAAERTGAVADRDRRTGRGSRTATTPRSRLGELGRAGDRPDQRAQAEHRDAGAHGRVDLRRRAGSGWTPEVLAVLREAPRARHVLRGRVDGRPRTRSWSARSGRGHEIGVHTFTHPDLAEVSTATGSTAR